MKIVLHIGPTRAAALRVQQVLADKRAQLRAKGVLFPSALGRTNHTGLYMAMLDGDHVDPHRYNRGVDGAAQAVLRDTLALELAREIGTDKPEILLLSAWQMGSSLHRRAELQRLHDWLRGFSDDIAITAQIGEPAAMLAEVYGHQVQQGRAAPLSMELDIANGDADWWDACLDHAPEIRPDRGQFIETQAPPFWLDFTRLQKEWEAVFGADTVRFAGLDRDALEGDGVPDIARRMFGIDPTLGKSTPAPLLAQMSAEWVTRARQFNALVLRYMEVRRAIVPGALWTQMLDEFAIDGDPVNPATLADVTRRFRAANAALVRAHDGLETAHFKAPRPRKPWVEPETTGGFRASQYLLAGQWRIDKATREARRAARDAKQANATTVPADSQQPAPPAPQAPPGIAARRQAANPETPAVLPAGTVPTATPRPQAERQTELTEAARAIMPPLAVQNFEKLQTSRFAPHNRLGAVNEEALGAAFLPEPLRDLPPENSGRVIVGCMKNEAPYIVEWVAYHRAIGVDNFLIYTNDCSDGTSEILDRLQEMGVLQHRNNDDWKGNSPQQYALNNALKEPVILNAEWIIHIDVDEFINVRCGNGTLDGFFDRVPDATNVAMTWRLFGHNGVTELRDDLVIDQFDTCAPSYCPKPHTVWGFKTMFRNIGAYAKLSCHRPNKLDEAAKPKVRWVNGSGKDMTDEAIDNGWRSSKKSIGYDLLQLNHYALRSADSFLIKRQRGRALHVDRSIGINYWVRMDWSVHRDVTIKRNLPRVRAEYDRLMQDETLAGLHRDGFAWHQAKAQELHGMPEFQELYDQALKVQLTETERVAYALALDMES